MPLIKANGVELFYDLDRPGRGARRRLLEFARHHAGNVGRAGARPCAATIAACATTPAATAARRPSTGRPAIDDLAGDLAGLLDGLGIDKAHLVGLSLGGMTAQAFAARYPQRRRPPGADGDLRPSAAAGRLWNERATLVRDKGMKAIVEAVWRAGSRRHVALSARARRSPVRDRFLAIDPRRLCRRVPCHPRHGPARRHRRHQGADPHPGRRRRSGDAPRDGGGYRARIPGAEMVVLRGRRIFSRSSSPTSVNPQLLRLPRPRVGGERATPAAASASRPGSPIARACSASSMCSARSTRPAASRMPWQDFITRTAWGEIWGDPRIPRKTRSCRDACHDGGLHREEEFKLHVRPALRTASRSTNCSRCCCRPPSMPACRRPTRRFAGCARSSARRPIRRAI